MSKPTEAEQLIAELAASDPQQPDPADHRLVMCHFCQRRNGGNRVIHAPTCLWLRAQPKTSPTYPLVVKTDNSDTGKGVSVVMSDPELLENVIRMARIGRVIVEQVQPNPPPIDTTNLFGVGLKHDGRVGADRIRAGHRIPSNDAVNLAYHLLRVADPDGTAFEAFKEAVKRDG